MVVVQVSLIYKNCIPTRLGAEVLTSQVFCSALFFIVSLLQLFSCSCVYREYGTVGCITCEWWELVGGCSFPWNWSWFINGNGATVSWDRHGPLPICQCWLQVLGATLTNRGERASLRLLLSSKSQFPVALKFLNHAACVVRFLAMFVEFWPVTGGSWESSSLPLRMNQLADEQRQWGPFTLAIQHTPPHGTNDCTTASGGAEWCIN